MRPRIDGIGKSVAYSIYTHLARCLSLTSDLSKTACKYLSMGIRYLLHFVLHRCHLLHSLLYAKD